MGGRGWVPEAASPPFPALTGSLPKWVVNKSSQFLAPKVSGLGILGGVGGWREDYGMRWVVESSMKPEGQAW